ncbi:nuclear transport factor 2 family protein [Chryseolinea sp. T2]|uniref:nuclear transport factor 2 family protein n=1 Tax=Chryseolinea sp. T2 TaxID=3129255 RepID=UPI003076C901
MKTILTLFACLLVINTTMNAQSKDEKEVLAIVESFRQAMMNADRATLEKIAAPELVYVHSSGLLEDKASFVNNIANRKFEFKKIEYPDVTVKITGPNAVVRHKITGDTANDGVPATVNIGVLLVFQKQKGEWKLIARQAYKL